MSASLCYACNKSSVEIAGLCDRCERIRSKLHSGVLDAMTRERDTAIRERDAMRSTLIDVLGEPARDLEDVAGMAANVIRGLRADAEAIRLALDDAPLDRNFHTDPAAAKIRALVTRVKELLAELAEAQDFDDARRDHIEKAHRALDAVATPHGVLAERIRALIASRAQAVVPVDPVAVVALLDALDAMSNPDAPSVTLILRALRALVAPTHTEKA